MKNLAFLAFPEQAELLISELAGRFGITQKPDARYGDLLYFENLALPEGENFSGKNPRLANGTLYFN